MLNDDVVIQDFSPSTRMRRAVVVVLALCAVFGFANGVGLFSGRTVATPEELPDVSASGRSEPVQVAEEFRPPEAAPPAPPPEKTEEAPPAKTEAPPAKKEAARETETTPAPVPLAPPTPEAADPTAEAPPPAAQDIPPY